MTSTITPTELFQGRASAPHGPAMLTQERNAMAARVPFVLPQVTFVSTSAASTTIIRNGMGFEALVSFPASGTTVPISHNLAHPIQNVWVVSAPTSVFYPRIAIASNGNAVLVLFADTSVAPVVIAGF